MSDAKRNNKIPTIGNLRTLSRRQLIAFAARAARRVQPNCIPEFWSPEAYKSHINAIDQAITLSEQVACKNSLREISAAVRAAAAKAAAARDIMSRSSAQAAAAAYVTAKAAADYATATDLDFTLASARAAALAASRASQQSRCRLYRAFWSDLQVLQKLPNHPLDVTEAGPLGPLWPEGPPDWYVEKKAALDAQLAAWAAEDAAAQNNTLTPPTPPPQPELELTLVIPEGVGQRDMLRAIRRLVAAADNEHRQLGGHGLKIDSLEIESFAMAEVTP